MVSPSEIASPANDYNLNIPRYIDYSEPEDLHDTDAHLRGGISEPGLDALEKYWDVFPPLREDLFEAGDRPGYSHDNDEETQVLVRCLALIGRYGKGSTGGAGRTRSGNAGQVRETLRGGDQGPGRREHVIRFDPCAH